MKKGPGKKQKKNCCFKCGSEEHGVFHCPKCDEEEARALWSQNKGTRAENAKGYGGCASVDPGRALSAAVEGHAVRITLDTGADQSTVSQEAVRRLESKGVALKRRPMETPRGLRSFSNEVVPVEEEVTCDLMVPTESGQLLLRNVSCWVSPHPLPPGLGDFLLSRHLMQKLGFDEHELLTKACQRADEQDMAVAVECTTAEEGQLEKMEAERLLPDLSMKLQEEESQIRELLRDKTEEAKNAGDGAQWSERLGRLLQEHWDVFRWAWKGPAGEDGTPHPRAFKAESPAGPE
jgi:hypothetical protein